MDKKYDVSLFNDYNIVNIDKLLWYKRNKLLQDVSLLENNQLVGGNSNSTSRHYLITLPRC